MSPAVADLPAKGSPSQDSGPSAGLLGWVCLSKIWPEWKSALVIVRPDTVLDWQREAAESKIQFVKMTNERPFETANYLATSRCTSSAGCDTILKVRGVQLR